MTTATQTLTAFLLDQLDADEAAAPMVVTGREWRDFDGGEWRPWPPPTGVAAYHRPISQAPDPHVLAQVAAHRAIVELHESWPVLVDTPPTFETMGDEIDRFAYRASSQIAWLTTQEYRARFGDEPPTTPILRALASIYADREGWREEWR